MSPSEGNQKIDLQYISIDWLLYNWYIDLIVVICYICTRFDQLSNKTQDLYWGHQLLEKENENN